MSTFHEETAMAHGTGNPMWMVTYLENFSGNEVVVEVRAAECQQAINKATDRLSMDFSKPEAPTTSSAVSPKVCNEAIHCLGVQP